MRKGTGFGWVFDLHQRDLKPGSHAYKKEGKFYVYAAPAEFGRIFGGPGT